jgi:microcystin-dependent protein
MASRALGVVGSGTGLTTRALGDTVGAETTTLKQSDLPNVHQTVAINDPGHTHAINPSAPYIGTYSGDVSLNNVAAPLGQAELTIYSAYTGISASFYLNGNVTQTIPTNMSPTVFLNLLIKL